MLLSSEIKIIKQLRRQFNCKVHKSERTHSITVEFKFEETPPISVFKFIKEKLPRGDVRVSNVSFNQLNVYFSSNTH